MVALKNLWPRVAVGGVAAFDVYHDQDFQGAKRAVDEFFDAVDSAKYRLEHDTIFDRYYVVKLA